MGRATGKVVQWLNCCPLQSRHQHALRHGVSSAPFFVDSNVPVLSPTSFLDENFCVPALALASGATLTRFVFPFVMSITLLTVSTHNTD